MEGLNIKNGAETKETGNETVNRSEKLMEAQKVVVGMFEKEWSKEA